MRKPRIDPAMQGILREVKKQRIGSKIFNLERISQELVEERTDGEVFLMWPPDGPEYVKNKIFYLGNEKDKFFTREGTEIVFEDDFLKLKEKFWPSTRKSSPPLTTWGRKMRKQIRIKRTGKNEFVVLFPDGKIRPLTNKEK